LFPDRIVSGNKEYCSPEHTEYCRSATVQRRVAVQTRRRRTLALLTPGPRPVWARVWLRHWVQPLLKAVHRGA